jgi:hypothetical protein
LEEELTIGMINPLCGRRRASAQEPAICGSPVIKVRLVKTLGQ